MLLRKRKNFPKFIYDFVVFALSFTFLLGEIFPPSFSFVHASEISPSLSPLSNMENLRRLNLSSAHIKKMYEGKDKDRLIVLIRDLHCHTEAQLAIAQTIRQIQQELNWNHVLLEGAEGTFDMSLIQAFPEEKVRERAAKNFLKEGYFTGPEYELVREGWPAKLELFGVEKMNLYLANLKAFREVRTLYSQVKPDLSTWDAQIEDLIEKNYSPSLKFLQSCQTSLQDEGELKPEIMEQLMNLWGKEGKTLPDSVKRISVLLNQGKKFDRGEIENQHKLLLAYLQKNMVREDVEKFLKVQLEYQVSRMKAEEYHAQVRLLCQKAGGDFNRDFSLLGQYLSFQEEQQGLDLKTVTSAFEDDLESFIERMAEKEGLTSGLKLQQDWRLLNDLIQLKLLRRDLQKAKRFDFEDFQKSFTSIVEVTKKQGQAGLELQKLIQSAQHFYALALERDHVMAENALKTVVSRQWSVASKMNNTLLTIDYRLSTVDSAQQVAVLITGGFHTEGIQEILEEKGISYVTLTPNVTDLGDDERYEKLMMSEKISFDENEFSEKQLAARIQKDGHWTLSPPMFGAMLRSIAKGTFEERDRTLWEQLLGSAEIRAKKLNEVLNQWMQNGENQDFLNSLKVEEIDRILQVMAKVYPQEISSQIALLNQGNRSQAEIALGIFRGKYQTQYPGLVALVEIYFRKVLKSESVQSSVLDRKGKWLRLERSVENSFDLPGLDSPIQFRVRGKVYQLEFNPVPGFLDFYRLVELQPDGREGKLIGLMKGAVDSAMRVGLNSKGELVCQSVMNQEAPIEKPFLRLGVKVRPAGNNEEFIFLYGTIEAISDENLEMLEPLNYGTPMISFPGRMDAAFPVISALVISLVHRGKHNLTAVDLGIGYPPTVTLEQATSIDQALQKLGKQGVEAAVDYTGVDQFDPEYVLSGGNWVALFNRNPSNEWVLTHSYPINQNSPIPDGDEMHDLLMRALQNPEDPELISQGIRLEHLPYQKSAQNFQGKKTHVELKQGDFSNQLGGIREGSVDLLTAYNIFRYYPQTFEDVVREKITPLICEGGFFVNGFQNENTGDLVLGLYQKKEGILVRIKEFVLMGESLTLKGSATTQGQILPELEEAMKELRKTSRNIQETEINAFRDTIAMAVSKKLLTAEGACVSLEGNFVVLNHDQDARSINAFLEQYVNDRYAGKPLETRKYMLEKCREVYPLALDLARQKTTEDLQSMISRSIRAFDPRATQEINPRLQVETFELAVSLQEHGMAKSLEDELSSIRGNEGRGGLIGKLFLDAQGQQVVTQGVVATESEGVVSFTTTDGKPLYAFNGKTENIQFEKGMKTFSFDEWLNSLDAEARQNFDREISEGSPLRNHFRSFLTETEVKILPEDSGVKGFSDGHVLYLTKDLLNNPIALFHELAEGHYAMHPEELPPGVNAHTYLRGVGKDIRNLPGIDQYTDPEDLIKYIRSKLPTDRLNENEFALIRWNASQGRIGRALLYGLQDRIFGEEANNSFSEIVAKKAEQPVPSSDPEVEALLQEKSSLAFTESPDAVDQRLRAHAKRMNKPYVRVNLRDLDEMNSLITRVIVNDDGTYESRPGPLIDVIRAGGILFIDYENAQPQAAVQLNSLFDGLGHFMSVHGRVEAHANLRIVGAMPPSQIRMFDTSIYSRYRNQLDLDWRLNEVLNVSEAPKGLDGVEAELYESTFSDETLIGGFYLNAEGKISVRKGKLIEAIESGKPLIIQGGLWDNERFLRFIRQIVQDGGIEFNGKFHKFPDAFKIFKRKMRYEEGVSEKKINNDGAIYTFGTGMIPECMVNQATQDILFSRVNIDNATGKMVQEVGILDEEGGPIRLWVTSHLSDWVWHRIMHAKRPIEICLAPKIDCPLVYQKYFEGMRLKNEFYPSKWDIVKTSKAIVVDGSDRAFVLAKLVEQYPNHVVYPVTPATSLSDIASSIEIGKGRRFQSQARQILEDLRAGKTVILEGLERNPELGQYLSTVFLHTPYLMGNGRRVDLNALPGRLVLVGPLKLYPHARDKTDLSPQGDEIKITIQKEFKPAENKAVISDEDYQALQELMGEFGNVCAMSPSAMKSGLERTGVKYSFPVLGEGEDERRLCPDHFGWGLAEMRELCYYRQATRRLGPEGWREAIAAIVISRYEDFPELAAFMRVQMRLKFPIKDGRRGIDGRRLKAITNEIVYPMTMHDRYWQLLDCMSDELLVDQKIPNLFLASKEAREPALNQIRYAQIANADSKEKADFYKAKYGIKEIPEKFPAIIFPSPLVQRGDGGVTTNEVTPPAPLNLRGETEDPVQARAEKCVRLLEVYPAIFLRGPPGVGKSYLSKQLFNRLNLKNYGPVSVGADVSEEDVLVSSQFNSDEGELVQHNQTIAEWALDPEGGLLTVDEANLSHPDFWSFLEGIFDAKPYIWINGRQHLLTQRHKIVFTGNQEKMTGRRFQNALKLVPVVNFTEFDQAFFTAQMKEYLLPEQSEYIPMLYDLFLTFKKMGEGRSFSLRDVQEIAYRVRVIPATSAQQAVEIAWEVMRGLFTPEEKIALQHIIAKKYGVRILKEEKKQTGVPDKFSAEGQPPIVYTESVIDFQHTIEQFLRIRERRLQDVKLAESIQGKRGLLFEGPSGRGKDLVAAHELEKSGYQKGDLNVPEETGQNPKKFYHITASLNYDDMARVIERAAAEGAIVILSEMNQIPSAILEGKLNAILTGDAAPGFALIGTINSTDFGGRERLSTALQNRLIYHRINDYTQSELEAILRESLGGKISPALLTRLIRWHCYLRDTITNLSERPTIRELIRAGELLASDSPLRVRGGGGVTEDDLFPQVFQKIYGPVYFKILKSDKKEFDQTKADTYQEPTRINNAIALEKIAQMIIPINGQKLKLAWDPVTKNGGYYDAGRHIIALSTENPMGVNLEVLDHEAGHGLLTHHMLFREDGPSKSWFNLYMWLEDHRMENAVRHHFPKVDLSISPETAFVTAVQGADFEAFSKMKLPSIFLYTLSAYARGWLSREVVEQVSKLWEVNQGKYKPNPFKLALKYLDVARAIIGVDPAVRAEEAELQNEFGMIPLTLDQEEIEFQYYRAVRAMNNHPEMIKDYEELVSHEKEKPKELEKIVEADQVDEKVSLANERLADLKIDRAPISPGEKPKRVTNVNAVSANRVMAKLSRLKHLRDAALFWAIQAPVKILKNIFSLVWTLLKKMDFLIFSKLEKVIGKIQLKARYAVTDRAFAEAAKTKSLIPQWIKSYRPLFLVVDFAVWGWLLASWISGRISTVQMISSIVFVLLVNIALYLFLPSLFSSSSINTHAEESEYAPVVINDRPAIQAWVQVAEPATKSSPQVVRAELPEGTEVALTILVPAVEENASTLRKLLKTFFRNQLEFGGKVYGSEGTTLHVQGLIDGDPKRFYAKSGATEQEIPKEIVFVQRADLKDFNPMLVTVLAYLFIQGFTATVYHGNNLCQKNITDFATLKKALEAPSQCDEALIREDLSRRPRGSYIVTTLDEVQKCVEAEFLHAVLVAPVPEKPLAISEGAKAPVIPEEPTSVIPASFKRESNELTFGPMTKTVTMFDDYKIEQTIPADTTGKKIKSVTWSPDGTRVASLSEDGAIRIWEKNQDGTWIRSELLRGDSGSIRCVAWSADGLRIISGSDDGTLRIWEKNQDRRWIYPRPFSVYTDSVECVAWSPDGSRVVMGSDGGLTIWEMGDEQSILYAPKGHIFPVTSVAWSPDGSQIVSGNPAHELLISEKKEGKWISSNLIREDAYEVDTVAFSPDGSQIVTGSIDGWRVLEKDQSGQHVTPEWIPFYQQEDHKFPVTGAAWLPDGRKIISVSGQKTVRIWNGINDAKGTELKGALTYVISVACSPDGTNLVTGDADGNIIFWKGKGEGRKVEVQTWGMVPKKPAEAQTQAVAGVYTKESAVQDIEAINMFEAKRQRQLIIDALVARGIDRETAEKRVVIYNKPFINVDLEDLPLKDIIFLKGMTRVDYLNTAAIEDIAPLKELSHLRTLFLNVMNERQLSVLADLTQLETLCPKGPLSKNIQVNRLTNLKMLGFYQGDISDEEALEKLIHHPNRENLKVMKAVKVRDRQGRAEYLWKTQGRTYFEKQREAQEETIKKFLKEKCQVREEHMGQYLTRTPDGFLSLGLQNLGDKITDISDLRGMTLLKKLGLSYTQVRDISVLASIPYLEELDLRNTSVANITPLGNLKDLKILNLSDTLVADITPLGKLRNLSHLHLQGSKVKTIWPLMGQANLETVDLQNTSVSETAITSLFQNHPNPEKLRVSISPNGATYGCERSASNKIFFSIYTFSPAKSFKAVFTLRPFYINYAERMRQRDLILKFLREKKPGIDEEEINRRFAILENGAFSLDLSGIHGFESMEYFEDITNLEKLNLQDTSVEDPFILKFFWKNPNRQSLHILGFAGREFTWESPEVQEYIRRAKETEAAAAVAKQAVEVGAKTMTGQEEAEEERREIIKDLIKRGMHEAHTDISVGFSDSFLVVDLGGMTLNDIEFLRGRKRIRELNLDGTSGVADLDPIAEMDLKVLHLKDSKIKMTEKELKIFCGLKNLELLNLIGLEVDDAFMSHLFRLHPNRRNLAVLDIAGNVHDINDPKILRIVEASEKSEKEARVKAATAPTVNTVTPEERARQKAVILKFLKEDLKLSGDEIAERLKEDENGFFSLDLNSTKVRDIKALSGLTNLQELHLQGAPLQDISALSGLTNLRVLDLLGNMELQDIGALSGLTKLQDLSLMGTKVRDISPLSALINLESLRLDYTPVEDIRALSALTNLQGLALNGTKVKDVSALSGLTNLQGVGLDGTLVQDISMLKGLKKLRELHLERTKVEDSDIFEFFRQHPNRENLLVVSKAGKKYRYGSDEVKAYIKTATGLQSPVVGEEKKSEPADKERERQRAVILKFLREDLKLTNDEIGTRFTVENGFFKLDLSGMPVQDIRALSGLTNLKVLHLARTQVQDISALSGLTNLQSLDLDSTSVEDITALRALTHLQWLSLNRTKVKDISALNGLTNFQGLYLAATEVQDSAIFELFRQNPNRENLVVTNASGEKYKWDSPEVKAYIAQKEAEEAWAKADGAPASDASATLQADKERLRQRAVILKFLKDDLKLPDDEIARRFTEDENGFFELNLINTPVNDISVLRGLTNLKRLKLFLLGQDISALSGLKNLKGLSLIAPHVKDISALSGLTNLQRLGLDNTPVHDISVLNGLTNLTELTLDYTQVQDIGVLGGLTKLQTLRLNYTNVKDISALSGLTNLQRLGLDNTPVHDISVLNGLTNLQWLSVDKTNLKDSDIYELFRQNPNRKKLRIGSSSDPKYRHDSDEVKAYIAQKEAEEARAKATGAPAAPSHDHWEARTEMEAQASAAKAKLSPRERMILNMVGFLVDPAEALEKVAERLQGEGKDELLAGFIGLLGGHSDSLKTRNLKAADAAQAFARKNRAKPVSSLSAVPMPVNVLPVQAKPLTSDNLGFGPDFEVSHTKGIRGDEVGEVAQSDLEAAKIQATTETQVTDAAMSFVVGNSAQDDQKIGFGNALAQYVSTLPPEIQNLFKSTRLVLFSGRAYVARNSEGTSYAHFGMGGEAAKENLPTLYFGKDLFLFLLKYHPDALTTLIKIEMNRRQHREAKQEADGKDSRTSEQVVQDAKISPADLNKLKKAIAAAETQAIFTKYASRDIAKMIIDAAAQMDEDGGRMMVVGDVEMGFLRGALLEAVVEELSKKLPEVESRAVVSSAAKIQRREESDRMTQLADQIQKHLDEYSEGVELDLSTSEVRIYQGAGREPKNVRLSSVLQQLLSQMMGRRAGQVERVFIDLKRGGNPNLKEILPELLKEGLLKPNEPLESEGIVFENISIGDMALIHVSRGKGSVQAVKGKAESYEKFKKYFSAEKEQDIPLGIELALLKTMPLEIQKLLMEKYGKAVAVIGEDADVAAWMKGLSLDAKLEERLAKNKEAYDHLAKNGKEDQQVLVAVENSSVQRPGVLKVRSGDVTSLTTYVLDLGLFIVRVGKKAAQTDAQANDLLKKFLREMYAAGEIPQDLLEGHPLEKILENPQGFLFPPIHEDVVRDLRSFLRAQKYAETMA